MKKYNSKAESLLETVRKCLDKDKEPEKDWCVYKHDKPVDKQPKGWPKHYKTKKDAKYGVKMMKTFKG